MNVGVLREKSGRNAVSGLSRRDVERFNEAYILE